MAELEKLGTKFKLALKYVIVCRAANGATIDPLWLAPWRVSIHSVELQRILDSDGYRARTPEHMLMIA
jgi:hypothetical protein